VIDTTTDELSGVIAFPGGTAPIVSRDGTRLYLGNSRGATTIFDASSLEPIGHVAAPAGLTGVSLRAITPDGENILESPGVVDGVIEVNIATGSAQTLLTTVTQSLVISPDGHYLYATCSSCAPGHINLHGIVKYDLVAHKAVSFSAANAFSWLSISPDGSKLYFTIPRSSSSGAQGIEVFDTTTMQALAVLPQQVTGSLALSPDGTTIWALAYVPLSSDPGTLYQIDAQTYQLLKQVPVAAGAFGLSVTPDGSKVYFAETVGGSSGYGIYHVNTQTQTFLNTYFYPGPLSFPAR
jgi:DNA-binding beta-propeller fold protein YncE